MELTKAIKKRRSVYSLNKTSHVSDDEIASRLEETIINTPTAFGSEAVFILLALGNNHSFVWDSVLQRLKPLTKPDKFPATASKIASFKETHGTILFFKKSQDIEELKKQFPLYASRQDNWGEQNIGIAVYAIWLTLTDLGLGASLQHYDPLIDEEIHAHFKVPSSYKLEGEMVFGDIKNEPGEKEFGPKEERFSVSK